MAAPTQEQIEAEIRAVGRSAAMVPTGMLTVSSQAIRLLIEMAGFALSAPARAVAPTRKPMTMKPTVLIQV